MNFAPPKELFSRQWFDAWDTLDPWEYRTWRIDVVKKKLEELEVKLSTKIRKNGGYHTIDLLVNTVTLLNSNIGVWNVRTNGTSRTTAYRWEMIMRHPHNSKIMSKWDETILGGVQREGICWILLSDEAVKWLNDVAHWVGE